MPYSEPSESRWIDLAEEPLPLAEAHRFLIDERAGGVCVFTGVVRRWTDGVETPSLGYEAYEKMAQAEMARLADEAESSWPVVRLVLLHRLGDVPAGEASVLVGVACPHRAEAFEACRRLIDTLKEDVPVWKAEHNPDPATNLIESPTQ